MWVNNQISTKALGDVISLSFCLNDWTLNPKEISFKIVKNSQDHFPENPMNSPCSHIRLFTVYHPCLNVHFSLLAETMLFNFLFIPSHECIPIRCHSPYSWTLPLHFQTAFFKHWLCFNLLITIMHKLRFLIMINNQVGTEFIGKEHKAPKLNVDITAKELHKKFTSHYISH